MKKIYVAGKLNADAVGYLYNCHKMMNAAELLREAGYATYVPCLVNQMGMMFGWEDYHNYFDSSQPWLLVSDAVYLVEGWETSKGTIREINTALENDIPVFDYLPEMSNHFDGIKGGAIVSIALDAENNVEKIKKYRTAVPGYAEELVEKPKKVKKMLYDAKRA